MRRTLAILVLTLVGLGILLSCSKKSKTPPTSPDAEPACSLSASALSFGSVTVGQSADRSFSLTNAGGGTLTGAVSETRVDFAIVGSAAFNLGAGAAATFTVRFSPTSVGARACTLATGSPRCASIVCSGTGETATPICNVQSPSLDFGALNYGGTAGRRINIQNAGTGSLNGSISGTTVDFSFIDPPTFDLGPGTWANIGIEFHPTRGGVQACTLQVQPQGCAPIVCRGEGVLYTHDHCSVSAISGTVDFGDVSIGFGAERTFTLKNFDNTYIARGSVTEACPEFELQGLATYNLSPGGTYLGRVRFSPSRPGPQECAIPINCWMDGSGTNPGTQSYVICRGVGVGGTPQCQVSTTSLSFGQVSVGQSKDLAFQITNTGTGTLSGSAGPSHCPEFTFVGSTKYSLGAGQSMTLTLRFTPTQLGHTITCSEIPLGLDCAALTAVGEGVGLPSCHVSTTALDFGSVAVGQSRDLTFDVENSGGGMLCGTVTESCPDFSVIQNSSYCFTPPGFVRVKVRFTPSATGLQQCNVSPGTGCAAVTVRGTGS